MILPDFEIPELANLSQDTYGIDSYDHCSDKKHFTSYSETISYKFNSRGYRDQEWPFIKNLNQHIWCVGDSQTMGIGTPFEYTWPQLLKDSSGMPVINVSMEGASNQWISRKSSAILEIIKPNVIVIMWSFIHRRESTNNDVTDFKRRFHYTPNQTDLDDCLNFNVCLNSIMRKSGNTKVIHFLVPNALPPKKDLPYIFNKIPNFLGEVKVLDVARDGRHFDKLTSISVVDKIIPFLNT